MILGSVQPAYLAWLPFFKRMQMSDVFVYLDDVEYSKNSPHNRNRIKSANGELLLTVPVKYKGNSHCTIQELPIANEQPWATKHWRSIESSYAKAPFFGELSPLLAPIYEMPWQRLAELNIALIEVLKDYLGIETPCHRSSELAVGGQANHKLVNLCRRLGADRFVVKPDTEDYHPRAAFEPHGIGFAYFDWKQTPYRQLHGEFLPNMSALDFAMNCGPGVL